MELAKNHPSEKLLKPSERWLMFDSGSNCDGADVGEHFPGSVNLVVPTGDARGSAECASGGVVQCRGKVVIEGPIDGQATAIPFRDMKIKMPIASLKNRVVGEDGFDIFITDGGAVMRHRRTHNLAKLYDRGGVYFAKFKPHAPRNQKGDTSTPFGRLG